MATDDIGGDAISALFDEQVLAANAAQVRSQAHGLSDEMRYEQLRSWVLPSRTHSTIRMPGDFTQTNPAPVNRIAETDEHRTGGAIVSPVFDLLDVGRRLRRLPELLQSVNAISEPESDEQRRAKVALEALIEIELGHSDEATKAIERLSEQVRRSTATRVSEMWPETLVVYRCVVNNTKVAGIDDLLAFLFSQRTQQDVPVNALTWHSQMAALAGRNGHREAGLHAADAKQPDELSQWVPASLRRAQSRGQCFAAARWECAGSQIAKVTGHNDDYLFYRSPLTGDFDVECDVTAFTCQSMTAGTFLGNDGDRSHLWIGTFRNSARRIESQLTFSGFDDWIHHRAVSRTGIVTQSLNGLNAHVENVTSKPDPWFAVRSWWRMHAGAKDIRISGTPVIPESIDLSAAKDLRGWYPYFEESAGELGAAWEHLPDTLSSGIIVGHRGGPDAAFSESLLAYQRPLETVGSIEYEFFYEPGQSEVHPALDRMVFCLFPEGVRIHWLTDGIFDQTSLGPDNMFAVASAQSQTSPVPLKPGEWNGLILAVNQQSVTLHLNGQRICETELDAANDRVFGLFHYADQTEAKVRNVVMRGNWPTTLPDTTSQELADLRPAELDAELPKLSDVFTHDFSKGGIPAQLFAQGTNHPDGEVKVERDGLSIHRPGGGPWRDTFVNLPLIVHGDFDMEIVFEKFAAVGDEFGCIMLVVELDDEQRQQCRILRIRDEVQRHELHSSLSKIHQSGERSYSARLPKKSEASGGRLRMARRGTTLYYLFAENDSSVFRVLETEEISDRPSVANGLHFHTMCSGKGDTRVIWKSISVRAERLVSINVLNPQP